MTEPYDDLINNALSEFHTAEASAPGLVPGPATVRATVKRRRTIRYAMLGVLGAILVILPITAFAANPRGNNSPPLPGDSPSIVESTSPTPSETPPASANQAPPASDGRISLDQLTSSKLDLPPFETYGVCPTRRVKLVKTEDPSVSRPRPWVVGKLVYTNLDDDPALETAALVLCRTGETQDSEVVAFDLDASGKIRTLGAVVVQGDMLNIRDIRVRAAGGITADVSDIIACCGAAKSREQHQTREYAWNGTTFAQVGGPTLWGDPRYITDLQVTATDVTLGPRVNGQRTGKVTVTVKNNGPNPSGRFQVWFVDCSFSCDGSFPPVAWGTGYGDYHAPLAAGRSVTATLEFSFSSDTPGGDITAQLKIVSRTDERAMSDPDPTNNQPKFHVKAG
jgi:hypothetical protein